MAVPISLRRPLVLVTLLALTLMAGLAANGRITSGVQSVLAAVGPCGSGTAFFGSANVGDQFVQGETHLGATFTTIQSDPDHVNVVLRVEDKVGTFPSTSNGATAVIKFPQPIEVTGILWYGNHPNSGETGWSLNGIVAPDLGSDTAAACADNFVPFVTDTITIQTDESGGIDFWFDDPGLEGCTPGYWKNHQDSWMTYSPSQTLESVFDVPDSLGFDNTTLLNALKFGGGNGVTGGAKILLRAAVASLLNSAHAGVDFSISTAAVIADVNAALASGSRNTMIALAGDLDDANNAPEACPLN